MWVIITPYNNRSQERLYLFTAINDLRWTICWKLIFKTSIQIVSLYSTLTENASPNGELDLPLLLQNLSSLLHIHYLFNRRGAVISACIEVMSPPGMWEKRVKDTATMAIQCFFPNLVLPGCKRYFHTWVEPHTLGWSALGVIPWYHRLPQIEPLLCVAG